ncbi:MAG: helix-hairpin-helix domain-containing protein, partial [Culicoidibacterales bacterium]
KKMKKATKDALVQYLSSDLFSGIGKKTAEQLIEQLGENLVEEVLLNIELLDEVQMKGWTSKKAERFYDQLVEHSGSEQTLVFLTENGLSMNQARSVYQVFGVETIGQIRANPYVMIEKVPRIGFGIADRIAFSLGMTPLDERRLLAGIQTTIQEFCQQNGHTYMVKPEIIAEVFRILQLDSRATSEVEAQLVQLQQQKRLVPLGEDEYVLPLFMQAERTIAQQLLEINQREITVPDSLDVVHFIHQCEQRLGIQYAEQQKQAIVQALQVPISILTGGPGTGKTTVIQGLIDAMCQSYEIKPDLDEDEQSTDFPIVLLAPTGKAEKRMKAATGYEAMT